MWTQLVPETSAPTEREWLFFMLVIQRDDLSGLLEPPELKGGLMFTMAEERFCGLPAPPNRVLRLNIIMGCHVLARQAPRRAGHL